MNKVKDRVRKRQKRMSNVAELRGRRFNNLGNVCGCDDECGDIHGKECKSVRLLGFCVVPWKGSLTSSVQQSLEEKD